MSSPSISVMNCGRAFSVASHLRQSYSVAQWRARSRIIASGTPCDWSATVSLSGQRVAAIRARSASSSASGNSIVNGLIAVAPAEFSVVTAMWVLLDLMTNTERRRLVCLSRPSKPWSLTGSAADPPWSPRRGGRASASGCRLRQTRRDAPKRRAFRVTEPTPRVPTAGSSYDHRSRQRTRTGLGACRACGGTARGGSTGQRHEPRTRTASSACATVPPTARV